MHQDATHHGARPRPRRLCVRWGSRSPPQKGAESPQFSAHVYCGQTVRLVWMSLVLEVGLGPGHCISWGPKRHTPRGTPPIFGPCLLWSNGCMDRDATWYGGRPRPSIPASVPSSTSWINARYEATTVGREMFLLAIIKVLKIPILFRQDLGPRPRCFFQDQEFYYKIKTNTNTIFCSLARTSWKVNGQTSKSPETNKCSAVAEIGPPSLK